MPENTYRLVRRGFGTVTHIAHPIGAGRTWCYCPLGNTHPLPSTTRPAGEGDPTCKTCRKLAGLPNAAVTDPTGETHMDTNNNTPDSPQPVLYGSSAGLLSSAVLRSVRDRGRVGTPRLAYAEWAAEHLPCAEPDCDHTVGAEGCSLDRVDLWLQANTAVARGRTTKRPVIDQTGETHMHTNNNTPDSPQPAQGDENRPTGAEVRATREWLGFSVEELADELQIAPRTIDRIEAGRMRVNDYIAASLVELTETADEDVAEVVERLRTDPAPVYVVDDTTGWPPRWQRMVAMRARQEIPGLRIVNRSPALTTAR